jgi:hypothetical protein
LEADREQNTGVLGELDRRVERPRRRSDRRGGATTDVGTRSQTCELDARSLRATPDASRASILVASGERTDEVVPSAGPLHGGRCMQVRCTSFHEADAFLT